jgi:hypothetical protein
MMKRIDVGDRLPPMYAQYDFAGNDIMTSDIVLTNKGPAAYQESATWINGWVTADWDVSEAGKGLQGVTWWQEIPTDDSLAEESAQLANEQQFAEYQSMKERIKTAMTPMRDYVDAPKHKFTRRPFILSDILIMPVLVALVLVMATDVHDWWAAFWIGFIGGYVIQSVILTTYISIESLYHGRYWSHEDVSELSEEVHDLRVNNRVLKNLVDEYQELLGGPDTYVVGESKVK